MEDKIQQQLDELEIKISEIHLSTKRTEKYLKVTFWITVTVVVVPMIIALFVVPMVIGQYLSMFEGII